MTLREVLLALRATWWLPVAGVILGSAAALAVSLAQTPLYTSTTQMFVSTTSATSTSDIYQGSQFSQERVASYARLIPGQELAGRVVDRLGLQMSPETLSGEITETADTETVLIDVTVTDPSAQQAASIADAIGEEFSAMVAELETPVGSDVSPVKVTVTDPPEVATTPSSPKSLRNVAVGALAGLIVGAGLSLSKAHLDRSLTDQHEVAAAAGAPVIGMVLRDEALKTRPAFVDGGGNRTAEEYRKLRNHLQFIDVVESPSIIMVSSPLPGEGKTTTALNLGLALADAGRKVTVLEADLRRPRLPGYLGLAGDLGLTNFLAGTAGLDDVIHRVSPQGLSVIPPGPVHPDPGEVLTSPAMLLILEQLRQRNDFVLVDAPPLLTVADSSRLAASMDGVLLAVRYGRTREEQVQEAAAAVKAVGGRLLGVILNMVPPRAHLSQGYDYRDEPRIRRWRKAPEQRAQAS